MIVDEHSTWNEFNIKSFDMKIQHTEVNIEVQRTKSGNFKIEIQHDKIDL